MITKIDKKYYFITADFLKYLPSRFYVLTNILIIIPVFTRMLSIKEMGLFQIGISILNLICTIFFDWISKSVLRFHEASRNKDILNTFINNIFAMFIANYLILAAVYFAFAERLSAMFFIDRSILAAIMILVIPCIARQFLYQLLRLFNRPFLYAASIVVYQAMLVFSTILLIHGGTSHVLSIFIAMAVSIALIDLYIIKELTLDYPLTFKLLDFSLVKKYLKYGIPLVVTNLSIWAFFHFNKYYFQKIGDFTSTGELALSYFVVNSVLMAIFSTFLFAVFPRIIKKFELGHEVGGFQTAIVRLYCVYFIPLTVLFCFYPKQILALIGSEKYVDTAILLPFFAISIFIHELVKIINVKYHLQNKTYIETAVTVFTGVVCIILNLILLPKYGIVGAGCAMMISFLILILINSSINFKDLPYINFKKVFYSALFSLAICVGVFFALKPFDIFNDSILYMSIKLLLFLCLYYAVSWQFKGIILK